MHQSYSVNSYTIYNILNDVDQNNISIPEMQRPFVWSSIKVRDLLDSLYNGYPIGYVITWKNPDIKDKNGIISAGRKVLIDGQQRITALKASLMGDLIINKDYEEEKIIIAFNPQTEKFETLTPAIEKDSTWISDISKIMNIKLSFNAFAFVEEYAEKNPGVSKSLINDNIMKLISIKDKSVGIIELNADLDIDTVTEIFIRINSAGVVLGQADFVMSKMSSYDVADGFGSKLRKCIDYFCHLSKDPLFFSKLEKNDKDFVNTDYFTRISWLKNETSDLYDPDYNDVLRTCFTKQFSRGKMSDLVSLLSGRNFETRTYERDIMDKSFMELKNGVLDFISETNFKRFLMILTANGFIQKDLIRSKTSLNFAYALFLKLREQKYDDSEIQKYVIKWFVISLLTERYSSSPESTIDADIKAIGEHGIENALKYVEDSELSDNFWAITLVQELEKAGVNNPYLSLFFVAQIKNADKGFLSRTLTVRDLIEQRGDVHHLFPKEYLKSNDKTSREYNQIANFVYIEQQPNVQIGKKAPKEYFNRLKDQCTGGELFYGGIDNLNELKDNMKQNCIPESVFDMDLADYESFLLERRKLMAIKMEEYYKQL